MAYIDIALKKSCRGTIETNGPLKWVTLYVILYVLYQYLQSVSISNETCRFGTPLIRLIVTHNRHNHNIIFSTIQISSFETSQSSGSSWRVSMVSLSAPVPDVEGPGNEMLRPGGPPSNLVSLCFTRIYTKRMKYRSKDKFCKS